MPGFREFLKGLNLDKDIVNSIMAEYGELTTKNLNTIKDLQSQVVGLQEQVSKVPNTDELQAQITTLTEQVTTLTGEKTELETKHSNEIKGLKLDYALRTAIAKSNPIDEIAYKAHLDMSKIRYDEEKNELTGFDEQDKAIKEANAYLFQENIQSGGQEHGGTNGGNSQNYSIQNAVNEYYK